MDEASIRNAFDRVELRQKLSSSRIARVDSCEFSSEEKTCFSSELTPVSIVWGSRHVLIQRMLSSEEKGCFSIKDAVDGRGLASASCNAYADEC